MAVDLRLYNCLPEHQGPAFRTWSKIIETAAMSSGASSSPLLSPNSCAKLESSFPSLLPAEEFIPFVPNKNEEFKDEDDDKLENGSIGKRKRLGQPDQSRLEDTSKLPCAPWKRKAYPENAYGLHLEIKDFYEYMSPSPEEKQTRKDVVQRMTDLIHGIWPAARVEVFGSFKTNLYLPTSDIDLVIFGNWEKLPLWTLERALVNQDVADSASIKVLDKASVPIVKLTEKRSNIKVDISFNMDTAVKGAEMIQDFLKEHKVLPYLFLVLKHFLVMRDLNEVFTGGISSYCLMLLTVSFLQMHPRQEAKLSNSNIGVLLIEFLELYGRNFNYQRTGIKIRDGGCYCSKDEIMKEMSDGQFPSLLCIEDPVSKVIDIGKSSFGIMRVKEAFEYAYNVLDSALRNKQYFKINPNSTYLSRIVQVPLEVIEYRRWLRIRIRDETAQAAFQPSNDNSTHSLPMEANCSETSDKASYNNDQTSVAEVLHSDCNPHSFNLNGYSDTPGLSKDNLFDKNENKEAAKTAREWLPSFLRQSTASSDGIRDQEIIEGNKQLKEPCAQGCVGHKNSQFRQGNLAIQDNVYCESVADNSKSNNEKVSSVSLNIVSNKTDSSLNQSKNQIDMSLKSSLPNMNCAKVTAKIGAGGASQWFADGLCFSESSTTTALERTVHLGPLNQVEDHRLRDIPFEATSRRARSPCQGIGEHDLENARQVRQIIISSPEKPYVQPEKWGQEKEKQFKATDSKRNMQEERYRESRGRVFRKESTEQNTDNSNTKQHTKYDTEHSHRHEDNAYSHKHGYGGRRRNKREQKPS